MQRPCRRLRARHGFDPRRGTRRHALGEMALPWSPSGDPSSTRTRVLGRDSHGRRHRTRRIPIPTSPGPTAHCRAPSSACLGWRYGRSTTCCPDYVDRCRGRAGGAARRVVRRLAAPHLLVRAAGAPQALVREGPSRRTDVRKNSGPRFTAKAACGSRRPARTPRAISLRAPTASPSRLSSRSSSRRPSSAG